MPVNISELGVSKLRGYREFAFPPALALASHEPHFSIEMFESWVSSSGYELYDTWLKNSASISQDPARGQELVDDASTKDIKKFRETITTSNYAEDEYFSLENIQEWIRPVAFEAWFLWFRQATTNSLRPSSTMSNYTASSFSRPPSRMSETEDFKSDTNHKSIPPSSRATSPVPSIILGNSDNPIFISDSDGDEDFVPPSAKQLAERRRLNHVKEEPKDTVLKSGPVKFKEEPKDNVLNFVPVKFTAKEERKDSDNVLKSVPVKRSRSLSPEINFPSSMIVKKNQNSRKKGKGKGGAVKITSKLSVDSLDIVASLPSTWAVPRDRSATLVDLSGCEFPRKRNGEEYTIDGFIRAEDQDSWGGTTGHSAGDVDVYCLNEDDIPVRCRRVQLDCNGVDTCECFDESLLEHCERFEPDPEQMRELWNHELDANTREAGEAENIIYRFYSRIQDLRCKVPCEGKPIMRLRGEGTSTYGQNYFIGCSGWKITEKEKHRYLAIPRNVNEDSLSKLMDGNGALPDSNVTSSSKCSLTVHPKVGLKFCPFSHLENGKFLKAKMLRRKCPAVMLIFVPVDTSIRQAIVFLRGPHNHPMHPKTKPSSEEKVQLEKAIQAAGRRRLTVQKLLNAPSTSSIYDGKLLGEASPAFMDRRRLRDAVHASKMKDYPKGMGWEGLLHQHLYCESKLSTNERYIHAVMATGDTKWVITMHPRLSKYFHQVYYLVIDYTFKRVKGEIDEWEIVGFVERFKRRVTLARFYCDRNTRNAFGRLFSELFRLIPELTGSILKFSAFFPDDPNALLHAIILDAEAAQAQGLGDELLVYVAKNVSEENKTLPRNTLDLLMMVLKTCYVHYFRNIDKLPTSVSKDTIDRLKGFIGLKNEQEINDWHKFCRDSPDKSVQDWYQHKINYAWLLPSLNRFLSKMASKSWDLTPIHSNLVEGGHSATNAVTSIGQELAEAVDSARELDERVAIELEAMERSGVLPNRWNGPIKRERLSEQRRAWSREKNQTHQENLSQYEALSDDLATISIRHAESMNIDKALQEKIKTLRVHSHQDSSSKQEIKIIQKEIDIEKEKRRALKTEKTRIKKTMQELKDSSLNGSRINGRRPTTSTLTPTADNPPSYSNVDDLLPNINDLEHLEVPNNLNTTMESESQEMTMAEASSTNTAPYFNPNLNYIPVLEKDNWGLAKGFHGSASTGTSMGPGTHSEAFIFDPNGPGMGLDLDFSIFDVGTGDIDSDAVNIDHDDFKFNNVDLGDLNINIGTDMNYSTNTANFNFGDAINFGDTLTKEAEPVAPSLQVMQLPIVPNEKSESLTLAEVNNQSASMLQDPVQSSAEMRTQKRKKMDEVDKGDILPEGSRRNRNKTARARGLDS